MKNRSIFNYFDDVHQHIEKLGDTYLAQIAGTPSATGLQTQGFVARQELPAQAVHEEIGLAQKAKGGSPGSS